MAFAQTGITHLSGRVVDAETGEPLQYVSVRAGEDFGTLTNDEGDFRFQTAISPEAVLCFSYVGYQQTKIKASDLGNVIRLRPLAKMLDEVTIGKIEIGEIIGKVIGRLSKDYKKNKASRENYFYRTVLSNGKKKQIVEAFLKANNAVNLNQLAVLIGIVGMEQDDGSETENEAAAEQFIEETDMQWLVEVGPHAHGNAEWEYCIKPLDKLSTTQRFYGVTYEFLSGEDGENIIKIDFQLLPARYRPQTDKPVMVGTAFVGERDYRLLRFEGEVLNLTMSDGSIGVPEEFKFQIDYDHSQGFTEVASISIDGGARQNLRLKLLHELSNIRYKTLVFHMRDRVIQGREYKVKEMLSAIKKVGYDSELWDKYEVVRRSSEERLALQNKEAEQEGLAQATQKSYGPWAKFVNRLDEYGQKIPQEKVYIHMDNTSYFLGDTIWFKAYLRQTNTDTPSRLSGTLYVELLNHDGYLMERKIIELKNGEGDGYFQLPADNTTYAGFYELRAYTRWQLNWGELEHEHSKQDGGWFVHDDARRDFFRDYEKLYSRVFPVYNHPAREGEYNLDMTLRPLMRQSKADEIRHSPTLSLFPEGGNLVADVPNRVAFEAARTDGETLPPASAIVLKSESGLRIPLSIANRGRGVFEITPKKGERWELELTTPQKETVTAKLPQPQENGAALSVRQIDQEWLFHIFTAGSQKKDSLALTVTHEGKVLFFRSLAPDSAPEEKLPQTEIRIRNTELPAGVCQATVFDTQGRIHADRLFFVSRQDLAKPNIIITGAKDEYQPYEQIQLDIKSPVPSATLSLSVRDATHGSRNFDTGNILTEMLLSSEIRGFIPDPAWFFEKDDEEHLLALDLLMMTQGWRRFRWPEMTAADAPILPHPAEKTPTLTGSVLPYQGFLKYNPKELEDLLTNYYASYVKHEDSPSANLVTLDFPTGSITTTYEQIERAKEVVKAMVRGWEYASWRKFLHTLPSENANTGFLALFPDELLDMVCNTYGLKDPEHGNLSAPASLKRDVLIHCELLQPGSSKGFAAEVATRDGNFSFQLPRFQDFATLFLAASDTTKWKPGTTSRTFQWVMPDEEEYPEFSVRLSLPFPHFAKPYSFYQMQDRPLAQNDNSLLSESEDAHTLATVHVKGRKQGISGYRYAKPALAMDAYEAYNMVVDAGLMSACFQSARNFADALAHYFVADMGGNGDYKILTGYDDILTVRNRTELNNIGESTRTAGGQNADRAEAESNYLRHLDSVFIYTDYAPRLEGDRRFRNNPDAQVTVLLKRFKNDEVRLTYRDRFLQLPGFASPAEFYSPDYSHQTLPEQKDYRRTLYWNPSLRLDSTGRARITLYNNSRRTVLSIDAQGQSPTGHLLFLGEK